MNQPTLPTDPLTRFRDIYEALNADRGWFDNPASLRFAAVSAMLCPGDPPSVAAAIRQLSGDIKAESGWFGPLDSHLRFVVAALALAHGDSAARLLAEIRRVQPMFRDAALRRGSIYETMAILILRIQARCEPITMTTVQRFKHIYEEMKRYHWWLTGPDDFPACAILTGSDASPATIGSKVERIYQGLRSRGFSAGDPLQTAANLLFLARGEPEAITRRYRELADGFRSAGVRIWQSDYDELAILSFLDHPAPRMIERVLRYRAAMGGLRPKPDPSMTFNLASSIAFCDLVRFDPQLHAITDTKALLDMQAILSAQQAAAAGAAVAATASSPH